MPSCFCIILVLKIRVVGQETEEKVFANAQLGKKKSRIDYGIIIVTYLSRYLGVQSIFSFPSYCSTCLKFEATSLVTNGLEELS